VASLEVERLQQRRHLLFRRIEQLEVRCPVEGVVLTGDLERSELAPVNSGQTLFEVAPLAQLVCEVEIPDDSIAQVTAGNALAITLDAFPLRTWQATLADIRPRAEIREHRNVFIGQVVLNNDSGELRPGMRGRARIATSPQPLGWIIFHKPWHWLRARLEW
jgi:multidrug efflux pump subunit AcrA (membrane-fusion protein)